MGKIKTGPKIVVGLIAIGGLWYGARYLAKNASIGDTHSRQAMSVSLPPLAEAKVKNVQPVPFPSTEPSDAVQSATLLPLAGWEWNAQDGFILAIGGPRTTKGSLFEKYGVNASWKRIDSNDDMGTYLLNCAAALKKGA